MRGILRKKGGNVPLLTPFVIENENSKLFFVSYIEIIRNGYKYDFKIPDLEGFIMLASHFFQRRKKWTKKAAQIKFLTQ